MKWGGTTEINVPRGVNMRRTAVEGGLARLKHPNPAAKASAVEVGVDRSRSSWARRVITPSCPEICVTRWPVSKNAERCWGHQSQLRCKGLAGAKGGNEVGCDGS